MKIKNLSEHHLTGAFYSGDHTQSELDGALMTLVTNHAGHPQFNTKLDLLLSAGANILEIDTLSGQNILQRAICNTKMTSDNVRYILEKSSPNLRARAINHIVANDGKTTYSLAVSAKRLDMIQELMMCHMQLEPKMPIYFLLLPRDTSGWIRDEALVSLTTHPLLTYAAQTLTDIEFFELCRSIFKCLIHWHEIDTAGQTLNDKEKAEQEEKRKLVLNCAFRAAVDYGHEESVEKLLEAGADIDIIPHRDKWQSRTALEKAVKKNDLGMIVLLLRLGADVNMCGEESYRKSLLHRVISRGDTYLISMLLKHGANINHPLDAEDNLILLTIKRDLLHTMNQMICNNAHCLSTKHDQSTSVVHVAAAQKRSACLKLLMEKPLVARPGLGVDLNANTWCGKCGTPLHVATRRLCYKNMGVLIDNGAQLDRRDPCGKTALMIMVRSCVVHKPKLTIPALLKLIWAGCDVNVRSDVLDEASSLRLGGHLALDIAIGHRLLPVAKMLWEAGSMQCQSVRWFKHLTNTGRGRHFLYTKAQMIDFLNTVVRQPRSLMSLSRIAIHKISRTHKLDIQEAISCMDIPYMLKEYMHYADLVQVQHEYYRHWCTTYHNCIQHMMQFDTDDNMEDLADQFWEEGNMPDNDEILHPTEFTELDHSNDRSIIQYIKLFTHLRGFDDESPSDVEWDDQYMGV